MARPIPLELPPRNPRQELLARLEQAPIEHAEALLDSYELLQQLHDRRVLALLRAALRAGDKLVESATSAANSPDSIAAIRNAIILGKILASIDPELLQGFAVAISDTLGSAKKPAPEPPGLFALLSQVRRKEVRRSMGVFNRFLEVLGGQLKLRGNSDLKH